MYCILALYFHDGRGFTNHYLLYDFQTKLRASFLPHESQFTLTFQYIFWRSAVSHGNKTNCNCVDTVRFQQHLRHEMLFGIERLWSAVHYTSESSWNPKSNTMEPDRPQHDCLTAYVIAQHYSSATSPHCCFHVRQEKFCAPFKSVSFHFCFSFWTSPKPATARLQIAHVRNFLCYIRAHTDRDELLYELGALSSPPSPLQSRMKN